jgi:succinyl-CoA synthetase alpha subunit
VSVLLDSTSRVLVQGITGREAALHVPYMRGYGTRVVAGVSPGRAGEEFAGIPVYNSVRAALKAHTIDVSVLFVPARFVRDAALEAIESGIPLVVILAEEVPHHDTAEILARARELGVRVLGPNSQGLISPGKAKVGGAGGDRPELMFRPGPVGVISRSGGMGAEISMALTKAGIGQSTYVAIGGDLLIGTDYTDLLPLFQEDPQTHAVFLFGEPGTGREEAAAELIRRKLFTKPAVAFVAGEFLESLPHGMHFGHTGALIDGGLGRPSRKKAILREVGVQVAEHLDEIVPMVKAALASDVPGMSPGSQSSKR